MGRGRARETLRTLLPTSSVCWLAVKVEGRGGGMVGEEEPAGVKRAEGMEVLPPIDTGRGGGISPGIALSLEPPLPPPLPPLPWFLHAGAV